jgi:hypothetical protein
VQQDVWALPPCPLLLPGVPEERLDQTQKQLEARGVQNF